MKKWIEDASLTPAVLLKGRLSDFPPNPFPLSRDGENGEEIKDECIRMTRMEGNIIDGRNWLS